MCMSSKVFFEILVSSHPALTELDYTCELFEGAQVYCIAAANHLVRENPPLVQMSYFDGS